MYMRVAAHRRTLSWATVAGMLMGVIGLIALNGPPSVSAQADTTAPTVSEIAVTSGTGDDVSLYDDNGVYGIDDSIKVTVTFSEDVIVTGAPQLELDIGGTAETAAYESEDNGAVVFSYTVVEGDSDDDGIAISANKLELNGGTIEDLEGNAAVLSHVALAAQGSHKVDGVRPTVSSVSLVSSTAGSDGVYTSGETLAATAVFSEDIVVTGTPQLELKIGGTGRSADFSSAVPRCEQRICGFGRNPWALRGISMDFDYTVVEEDSDADGVGIDANEISLSGGTIKDAAGNDAVLTHEAAAEDSDFTVDGSRGAGGL